MNPIVHSAIHVVLLALLTGSAAYVVIRLVKDGKWKDRGVRVAAALFCVVLIAYVLFVILTAVK